MCKNKSASLLARHAFGRTFLLDVPVSKHVKRAAMIGVAVVVIAVAAAYIISFSDSQGTGTSGLIADLAMPYEKGAPTRTSLNSPLVGNSSHVTQAMQNSIPSPPKPPAARCVTTCTTYTLSQNRWRKIFPRLT